MTPAEHAKAQRDRTAARKAARRCIQCDAGLTPEDDQVANVDVREHLGLPDEASNSVSALFGRLARKGYLQRVGSGSDTAYRLTEAGRSAA
jgi:predicted transcriptional regulator of viral defense system